MSITPEQPSSRTPEAGWYSDPEGKPMSRSWDGSSWTDQVAPLGTSAAGQPGAAHTVDAAGQPVSPGSLLLNW